LEEDFLEPAHSQFGIIGPPISAELITATFADCFSAEHDLVQFYLRNNGGCRNVEGCLTHCGNPSHRVTRDSLDRLRIEGFFVIPSSHDDKYLRYRSMGKYYKSRLSTFSEQPEMTAFLRAHRPIATDHTGNDCWVNLHDEGVSYVLWDSWRLGPVKVATTFREFVERFWIKTVPDPDITTE
jgi:hypothetical protein